MAYSKQSLTLQRALPFLEQLLSAEGDTEWEADNPSKFAYKLREAIEAARHQPDGLPYAQLKERFTIRVLPGRVKAELRVKPVDDAMRIAKVKKALSTISLPEVVSLYEIVGAAIKHKADEMLFPNAKLDAIEEEKLIAWAKTTDYSVKLDPGLEPGMGVVLTRGTSNA